MGHAMTAQLEEQIISPRARIRRKARVLAVAAAVAGGGAAWWHWTHAGRESTDNAQLDAEVVAVPSRAAGTIGRLYFTENQRVEKGALLATLDDRAARARLAEAEATLTAAQAAADAAEADARVAAANARGDHAAARATFDSSAASAAAARHQLAEAKAAVASAAATLAQAGAERDRNRALFASGAVAGAELEHSETALAVARAGASAARARLAGLESGVAQAAGRVAEASARADQTSDVDSLVGQARARAEAARAQIAVARARRELAALALSDTWIIAPQAGVVSKKTVAEGAAVAAGQPIVELVTAGVWVTANYKETQIEHMRTGQPAIVEVDAFPSLVIAGEVESLSGATGSRFALLPPDNASGNFTKVVQRVPVRIRVRSLPRHIDLRAGMNATVTVDTRE
jgi:membrane fusion protein (multidrug efflux system)